MNKSLNKKVFLSFSLPGVSYTGGFNKVASGLDRVSDCINQEQLVPFSCGGGGGRGRSKRIPPQKSLKFQSPKNAIFNVLGTKFEDKRVGFFFSFKKILASIYQSQSIPTSSEQMTKT